MSMKVTVTGNLGRVLFNLARRWPSIQYGIMAEMGYEGRRELYESFLTGQIIFLRKYPYDVRGRRTVSYGIAKNRQSVKISSYPLNLYRPREIYSAARSVVETRIKNSLTEYDQRVLQKRINQMDRG